MSAFIELDLFSWVRPSAPATREKSLPKVRRTYPIIVAGLPHGGTADIETLVVDLTGKETLIP